MYWKVASAALTAVALTMSAHASLVTYTSRAAFASSGAYFAVDWGAFGPAGTLISTPDFRNYGARTVGVASSQGVLSRHDEGTDFTGDFAIGDHLLTDAGSQSDSYIISFDTPVRGFGAQMESDNQKGPWTGAINLFDVSNTLIGSIAISDNRGTAEDNSAPFWGVVSSAMNISYAAFVIDEPSMVPPRVGDIALNTMFVRIDAEPVPEPSSMSLAGSALFGLMGIAFLRRRRYGLV